MQMRQIYYRRASERFN